MAANKEYAPSPWLRRALVLLAMTAVAAFAAGALAVRDEGRTYRPADLHEFVTTIPESRFLVVAGVVLGVELALLVVARFVLQHKRRRY